MGRVGVAGGAGRHRGRRDRTDRRRQHRCRHCNGLCRHRAGIGGVAHLHVEGIGHRAGFHHDGHLRAARADGRRVAAPVVPRPGSGALGPLELHVVARLEVGPVDGQLLGRVGVAGGAGRHRGRRDAADRRHRRRGGCHRREYRPILGVEVNRNRLLCIHIRDRRGRAFLRADAVLMNLLSGPVRARYDTQIGCRVASIAIRCPDCVWSSRHIDEVGMVNIHTGQKSLDVQFVNPAT